MEWVHREGEGAREVQLHLHGGEPQLVQLGTGIYHRGIVHLALGRDAELVQLEGQLVQQEVELRG